jgi:hypothetical protein
MLAASVFGAIIAIPVILALWVSVALWRIVTG